MRTIVWDNSVDITLAGGLFGIVIRPGRNEDDKELIHLYIKQSITEEYIGDITKNETGNPAKFIPASRNAEEQNCENCEWMRTGTIRGTENTAYICIQADNQPIISGASTIVAPTCWCKHWKEKANGSQDLY
jgi:hypothetical protein